MRTYPYTVHLHTHIHIHSFTSIPNSFAAGGNLIVEHMLGAGREARAKAQLAVGRERDSSSSSSDSDPRPTASASARDERPEQRDRDIPPTERGAGGGGAGAEGLRHEPLQVKHAWVDPSSAGVPDLGPGDPMRARVVDDFKWRRLEAEMNKRRDLGGQGVAGAVRPSRAAELFAKHEEVVLI